METLNAAINQAEAFFRIARNPVKFKLFLASKLPAAFFSGLKVGSITGEACTVSIPFKWATKNPFRSTYFACLGMAAEMSTGLLCMANIYQRKPSASMLVTAMEGRFYKKATGLTRFVCNDGAAIKSIVEAAYTTLAPQTITAHSIGLNRENEVVAEFRFTWSFKVKH